MYFVHEKKRTYAFVTEPGKGAQENECTWYPNLEYDVEARNVNLIFASIT